MSLEEKIKSEPAYRRDQIYLAWFDKNIHDFSEITTLSKNLREQLTDEPWMTVKQKVLQTSQNDGTRKALLELSDGQIIETVLMPRASKKLDQSGELRYTVCISSQVGCPMGCAFCATGKLGFKRNLTYREIIDQIRFWQQMMWQEPGDGEVENIVLMGQGEPLLNYENVKLALAILIKYAKIGPRKITMSTVGVPESMEKMVTEKDFPSVRFALSLHSALSESRSAVIPSNRPSFLDFLVEWSKKYHTAFPSRTHFIGLEYIMLKGINDDIKHLNALIKLVLKLGSIRVNLIPYNASGCNDMFQGTDFVTIQTWQKKMNDHDITCTIRRSQGLDIDAACGQLANKNL
ncbi:MAG: 23S rRNA (adenine(2503)-C(2))-methyltransferase RlmN [Candidatus Magasanikbacteria bacterium]